MEMTANAAASSGSVLNAGISSRASKSEIADGTIFPLYMLWILHKFSNTFVQLFLVTNDGPQPEILNKRALAIVSRVRDKLTGRDFPNETEGLLSIQRQVELLIQQATSHENLCQCYIGW